MKYFVPLALSSAIALTACGGGGGGSSSDEAPAATTTPATTTLNPTTTAPTTSAEFDRAKATVSQFKQIIALNATENVPLFNHTVERLYPCYSGLISPYQLATDGGDPPVWTGTLEGCQDTHSNTTSNQSIQIEVADITNPQSAIAGGVDTESVVKGGVDYNAQTTSRLNATNLMLTLTGEADLDYDAYETRVQNANTIALDSLSTVQICSSATINSCSDEPGKVLRINYDGSNYNLSEFNYTLTRDIRTTFDTSGLLLSRIVDDGDRYSYSINARGKLDEVGVQQVTFNTVTTIVGDISEAPAAGEVIITVDNDTYLVAFVNGNVTVTNNATNEIVIDSDAWSEF